MRLINFLTFPHSHAPSPVYNKFVENYRFCILGQPDKLPVPIILIMERSTSYQDEVKGTGIANILPDPNPDKPQPKRTWLVREIPNPKFQIPNEEVSCGHILNAFGEEHTAAFLILKSWEKIFGL
jgi:hypothetical protein